MRFSCMKAVYEYTRYLGHSRTKKFVTSQESQQPGKRNTLKKDHRSDPIRCVAVMKLARYLRIDKSSLIAGRGFMLHLSCQIIMQYSRTGLLAVTDLFIWSDE